MKVVIAIDSFKGSLSSLEAGKAAAEGIKRAIPSAETVIRPIADGGEGTVEALVTGMGGELHNVTVTGPLGMPVQSTYGIIKETGTAIMEMSSAAGITLVPEEKRNPMHTTTYGVGEMIKDAISRGCRNFVMGIGGSATNDGGIGMLQALGFEICDSDGKPVPLGASGLENLMYISDENVIEELKGCTFNIACDVTNPLCGKEGCSAVYGPQKGATEEMVHTMDKMLESYAVVAKKFNSDADAEYPGAGAAGGLGFAFRTFLNGNLRRGIDLILNETGLESYIKDADIVITGEGRLDFQTAMGKAPAGIAAIAKKYNKPVIAFAGGVTKDASACNEHGIDAFFPIVRGVCSLEEAMETKTAYSNMSDSIEQVFRLLNSGTFKNAQTIQRS